MKAQIHDPECSWSYARHRRHESSVSQEMNLPSCYTNPHSIDAWRHRRMHETLLPLLAAYQGASWLTVGDGRFGSDAHFLRRNGAQVLASSLTDHSLAIAAQRGFIDRFQSINAEAIALPDASHDFVLCKESFHHFPRPLIALYEMLRVARIGVALIEPQETSPRLLGCMKNAAKTIIRRRRVTHYEPSGNFIFRVNPREIVKIMTALNYRMLAMKKLNDFYCRPIADERYSVWSLSGSVTRLAIGLQDVLCSLRLLDHGLATIVMFKNSPTTHVVTGLRQYGFKVHLLPENPYAQPSDSVQQ